MATGELYHILAPACPAWYPVQLTDAYSVPYPALGATMLVRRTVPAARSLLRIKPGSWGISRSGLVSWISVLSSFPSWFSRWPTGMYGGRTWCRFGEHEELTIALVWSPVLHLPVGIGIRNLVSTAEYTTLSLIQEGARDWMRTLHVILFVQQPADTRSTRPAGAMRRAFPSMHNNTSGIQHPSAVGIQRNMHLKVDF